MEKQPVVFTRYDIRGEYPGEIDESFALRLGKAAGANAKRLVVVGFDTRISSKPLMDSFVLGILGEGVDVIDIGISPSDKVSLAGGHYGADFAVMVTASHHPWNRNGFKFFYPKGNGFSNEDMEKIKKTYMKGPAARPKRRAGRLEKKEAEFQEIYIERAISAFKRYFEKIDAKVIVDCCEGAACMATPVLLERLGADVIRLNCSGKPSDSVDPEPCENNRKHMVGKLKNTGADLVVGHDPDADRIYAFDNEGKWISGDELFCIFARILGAKKIVASLDTSGMLGDASGAHVEYTRVGDIFVSEKAMEVGAQFCGEPNGHYTFPAFSWYNSGAFAALLLSAVAKQIPLMRRSFPKYFVRKEKLEFNDVSGKMKKMDDIVSKVKAHTSWRVLSEADGIKFCLEDALCLIRPSGTSHVLRVIVESKSEKGCREAAQKLKNMIA